MLVDEENAVYPSLRTAKFVEVGTALFRTIPSVDVSEAPGNELLLCGEKGETDV